MNDKQYLKLAVEQAKKSVEQEMLELVKNWEKNAKQ